MKKSIKITLIISIVVILLAVLVGGSVLIVKNWEYISGSMQGETYYTEEDLNNKYNEGYDDASSGTDNYRLLYEEVVKNLTQAQNEKTELTNQLAQVEAQVESLLLIIENKDDTINDLEDDILELQTTITNLNSQITSLNNQITYYQELLEAYEDSNKLIVSFIIPQVDTENVVYDVQVVDEGEYLGEVITPSYDKGTFLGWSLTPYGETVSLSNVQITENTSIYAVFDYTLEAFSWSEIESIANNGLAETYFDVGDEKTIELSNGEGATVAIMGFNHDDLTDGSGKAKITFGMTDILATQYAMENTYADVLSWEESTMRTEILPTIYTYLPEDLRSLIKAVDKETVDQEDNMITTSDKLWLFSWTEIYANQFGGQEGSQYEYFNNVIMNQANEILIKNINGTNSASGWWIRTPRVSGFSYQGITPTGSNSEPTANLENGVSFGFCI